MSEKTFEDCFGYIGGCRCYSVMTCAAFMPKEEPVNECASPRSMRHSASCRGCSKIDDCPVPYGEVVTIYEGRKTVCNDHIEAPDPQTFHLMRGPSNFRLIDKHHGVHIRGHGCYNAPRCTDLGAGWMECNPEVIKGMLKSPGAVDCILDNGRLATDVPLKVFYETNGVAYWRPAQAPNHDTLPGRVSVIPAPWEVKVKQFLELYATEVPSNARVVDFRPAERGEYFLTMDGLIDDCGIRFPYPILKLICKHPRPDMSNNGKLEYCGDCGAIREVGEWVEGGE